MDIPSNLKINAQLAMTDVLGRLAGLELIASGSRQRAPGTPGIVEGHQFSVSSLERALEVHVVVGGAEPGQVLVTLRPPAKTRGDRRAVHVLSKRAERWSWRSRGDVTPGVWWLELCWIGEQPVKAPLLWGYQVWGRSTLRAALQVGPRVATGAGLAGKVTLSGPARSVVRCDASLAGPPESPDARVARLHDAVPELRTALAKQRAAHWPQDAGRPWWRLRREHKLAALAEAKLLAPAPPKQGQPPMKPPAAATVKLTELPGGAGYDVKVPGKWMTAAGTYRLQVRLQGQVGADPEDRFERVLSRQVLAAPEPDLARTVVRSWAKKTGTTVQRGVELALWDAHDNPVLVDMSAAADLGPQLRRVQRDDGKLAWTVDADALASFSGALTLRGTKLPGSLDVPLIDARGFNGVVREGPARVSRQALQEALGPRVDAKSVGLRRQDALVVQPAPGKDVKYVVVFAEPRVAYAVEVLREGGKIEVVANGRGARRYAIKLRGGEAVRLRPADPDGPDTELEVTGLRFE